MAEHDLSVSVWMHSVDNRAAAVARDAWCSAFVATVGYSRQASLSAILLRAWKGRNHDRARLCLPPGVHDGAPPFADDLVCRRQHIRSKLQTILSFAVIAQPY